MPHLNIAGLTVDLAAPDWTVHEYFNDFIECSRVPDIHIRVLFKDPSEIQAPDGNVLFANDLFYVIKTEKMLYRLGRNRVDIPHCTVASLDYSEIDMSIAPEYDDALSESNIISVQNSILGSLLRLFSASLAYRSGLLIHSVSMIWENMGVLFTAPSGTGKTTHVNLWAERYGVKILNGDATACRLSDNTPVIYGVPWCGSSNIHHNDKAVLGAIIFLRQGRENKIRKLDTEEAILRLLERCYIQRWDGQLTDITIDILQQVAEKTDCYLLECLPDYDAVELVRRTLKD